MKNIGLALASLLHNFNVNLQLCTMKHFILTITVITMMQSLMGQVSCAVKINEILYAPIGGSNAQETREYVEVINYSNVPVDIGGWHIASDINNDLSNPVIQSDFIVSWQTRNGIVPPVELTQGPPSQYQLNTTIVPPGGVAIILDPTWNNSVTNLYDIPDNCVVMTLASFLNFGGYANSGSSNTVLFNPQDVVMLYNGDPNTGGVMVDSVGWMGLTQGGQHYSLQRDNDCEIRWYSGHPSNSAYVATHEVDTDMSITDSSSIGLHNFSFSVPQFQITASDTVICEGENVSFAVNAFPTCIVDSIIYTFDDAGSGALNSADSAIADHVFQTPGNYSVQCIIYKNCLENDTMNVVITVNGFPYISAGTDADLCENELVILTAINPDNASISWNIGVTDGVPFIQNVGVMTYIVTADNNGCIATDDVTITVYESPIVNAGPDAVICVGQEYILTAFNPTNDNLIWSGNVSDGIAFIPSVGLQTYIVTADNGECTTQDTMLLDVLPLPSVSFVADSLFGCAPFNVTFTNLTTGTNNNCVWNFGNGTSLNSCATVAETYGEGLYDVSLTVTDSYGCSNSQTYFDYIEVIGFPDASFYTNNMSLSFWDTEVAFFNTSLNASVYEWDFGDNSSTEFIENPVHTFPDALNQSYTVTLTATNEFGCSDEAMLVISVQDELIFYIPNSFTPDGNSFNQSFQPVFTSGFDPFDFHLTIFNRWGEALFESYDASVGWEGTYGIGEIAEDGVYIWQIEFKESMSNKRHYNNGHVTLLR